MDTETALRDALVGASLDLVSLGLNQGTAGNVSARHGDDMLITPSGVAPARTTPAMIASMPLDDAKDPAWRGPAAPSSEWRLHRDLFRHRADIGAIVHTHSPYATALATQRRDIPALHYMIAAFGVSRIRCTPYVPFGTQALSDAILDHIGHGHGVLLGNHGMVASGRDLVQAMWRATELEQLSRLYLLSAIGGKPVVLSDAEIEATIARFADYGMTKTG